MPNLASLLKTEISRLARKEVRSEIESLKKASSVLRSEVAALKRQVRDLRLAQRREARASRSDSVATTPSDRLAKFRPAGMKAHREKTGLSAKDYGLLVGASALSVYKWEDGKTKPREKALAKLAEVRRMGKREAMRKLNELRGG